VPFPSTNANVEARLPATITPGYCYDVFLIRLKPLATIALLGKAAVNAPQSKRFAMFDSAGYARQRLECGGFSTALGGGNELATSMLRMKMFAGRGSSAPFLERPGACRWHCANDADVV